MASDDETVGIDAVNAWLDHEKNQVVIALRPRGEEKYRTFRMTHADGDQLGGMLYYLVERQVLEAFTSMGWHYGWDLMRRAKMRSGRFYPALGRLERGDWVEAAWDEPELRRRRRMYRLVWHECAGGCGKRFPLPNGSNRVTCTACYYGMAGVLTASQAATLMERSETS